MKKLLIIFLFIPIFGSAQTIVNKDLFLLNFKKIINNYRWLNGLEPLEIDINLKNFTDYWSKEMSKVDSVCHGTGKNSTLNRVNRYDYIKENTYFVENCTVMITPSINKVKKCKMVHPDGSPWREYDILIPYIEDSYSGKITQYNLALYCFLLWKISPPHKRGMLNKDAKHFYVSTYRKGDLTYVSYISIN
jgi:uncharacterized protein YkwD